MKSLLPVYKYPEPYHKSLIMVKIHNVSVKYLSKGRILMSLSYDVASGSEITPCNKIDKPLVVYRFTGNVMKSITTLRTE